MADSKLSYGKGSLPLHLDDHKFNVTLITPDNPPPLKDARQAFTKAALNPIGTHPLRQLVSKKSPRKVAIAISDHTRPVPDGLLLPWVIDELELNKSAITILIGTGTHRDSTREELQAKLGEQLLKQVHVINHHCLDREDVIYLGKSSCGGPCWLNRHWVEADLRIATGFIEPHFYAGFSGGSKAIVPGIAGIETIRHFHRASLIDNPTTTWGQLENNALQSLCREMVQLCPPDFIVNVTLNLEKSITGIFVGDVIEAHRAGARQAGKEAIIKTGRKFSAVVTTNSGFPLDQNYYQTVKGISAASRICENEGHIIVASSCSQGLPSEGEFAEILGQNLSDADLLEQLRNNKITRHDQWQAQSLLQSATRFHLHLKSELPAEKQPFTRAQPCTDVSKTLETIRQQLDVDCLDVAIMPRGPLTIPVAD